MSKLSVSALTEAELRFGLARKPEAVRLKELVDEFLLRVDILPWDSEAARQYAEVRAMLELRRKSMGNMDMLIAAHALSVAAVLVTNDKIFRHVQQLKIEDWTKP